MSDLVELIERMRYDATCVDCAMIQDSLIGGADEIERLQARVDALEAEVKLWRDNEQNFPDALNRIDELESLLKGDDL